LVVTSVLFLTALSLNSMAESLEPSGPRGYPETAMKSLNEVEPRTLISALPFTITNSGSYYVSRNLVGVPGTNGITIKSSHVQLDLNGFALIGTTNTGAADNPTLVGVYISNEDMPVNITIRNGVICKWGQEGIRSIIATDSRVTGISVSGNGSTNGADGMKLGDSWNITDCLAVNNQGSGIDAQSRCTISRSLFRWNAKCGLNVLTDCRIFDCSALGNCQDGFRTGNDCVVRNCTANWNVSNGVHVAVGCVVADCVCSFNGNSGIGAGIQAEGEGRIEANHVRKNQFGIQIPTGATMGKTLVIRNSSVMNTVTNFDLNLETHSGAILDNGNMPAQININPNANFSL